MGLPEAQKELNKYWYKATESIVPVPDTKVDYYELNQILIKAFAEDEPILEKRIKALQEFERISAMYVAYCSEHGVPGMVCGCRKDTHAPQAAKTILTAKETEIKALTESWEHWKENCEKSSIGDSCFSIYSESCPCCTKYKTGQDDCTSCPLKGSGETEGEWCCAGLWGKVHQQRATTDIDFPALTKACEAVRNYVKEKLDEARGEFGVGDIVEGPDGWRGIVAALSDNYVYYTDTEGLACKVYPKNLKLLFPASKIPEWLRNNAVILFKDGAVGVEVLPPSVFGQPQQSTTQYLCWGVPENRNNPFYTAFVNDIGIERVIWPGGSE